jgi:periplasmic protein TonB
MMGKMTVDVLVHSAGDSTVAPPVFAPSGGQEGGPAWVQETGFAPTLPLSGIALSPEIAPLPASGMGGPVRDAGNGLNTVGTGLSAFLHLTAVALLFYVAAPASTLEQSLTIPVEIIVAAPPPQVSLPAPAVPPAELSSDLLPPVNLPPPAAPPVLAAALLPGPELPAPDRPPLLTADLLPAPDLKAPPPPAALPAALLPAPQVELPPLPPDPAGVLAAKSQKRVAPKPREDAAAKRRIELQARVRQLKQKEARLRRIRDLNQKRVLGQKRALAQRHIRERAASRSARAAASQGRRSTMSASAYRGLIAARLQRNKPSGDVALQASGTAVVSFQIASSGAATAVRLVRSAGNTALDRAALATIRRSSPFPPPPPGAARSFRVPVSFRR